MNQTMTFQPGLALSSVGRRFGALAIDWLVLLIPSAIFGWVLPVVGWYVGAFLASILYFPVLESSSLKGTLGKKVMDIQVVGLNGHQLNFRQALVRFLVKFVSSCVLFVGHFFAIFTERKQAAHDLVAETVVVHGVSQVAVGDAWVNSFRSIMKGMDTTTTYTAPAGDKLETLERLHGLKIKGAITEEEFQREKAKLGL